MGLSALLENQLGHLSKFQKLHIYRYSISTSGSKLSLFSFYGQQFLRYVPIFKIAIFRHETWSLTKVPEVGHILSFHPREVKIELIFALWAVVSEIRADLGHETWPLAKVPEVAHILSFNPKGSKLSLF